MLNPAFSRELELESKNYILSQKIISQLVINKNFNTGFELRLQKIYGDELWLKLKSLGLGNLNLEDKDILDIACGTGFLSYHLLSRVRPKSLTLLDISKDEINEAKKLLEQFKNKTSLDFFVADATKMNFPDDSFDVVIGNSFLHHFYNLPLAIEEFKRILKPGGLFITLHEPTIASLALESRNPKNTFLYIVKGDAYIDYFRHKGEGVALGQGGDVWMFKEKELVELFKWAGFNNLKIDYWHFLRAKIVATFGLWLSEKKPRLNFLERILLRIGIYFDLNFKEIFPKKFFSSIVLLAQKS